MGYLDNIDRGYQEQANLAAYWAGKDAQKQHEAHKVMQDLVNLRNQHIANQQPSGGGGGGHHHAPAPAPYVAPRAAPKPTQSQTSQVKVANVNVINLSYGKTPVKDLERVYFQDVGGTEILSVARHDTVGGEPVIYSPVDNLQDLRIQFNPLNILMSTKLDTLFSGYGIDITQKIDPTTRTITINEDTGSLEIEIVDVNKDEYVQIQVASRVEEFGIGD